VKVVQPCDDGAGLLSGRRDGAVNINHGLGSG